MDDYSPKGIGLLQQLINNRWFAFANLLVVFVSGAVWVLIPRLGLWFTLVGLLLSGFLLLGSRPVIKHTPIDWFVLVFLITAIVGYWAAYDKASAWIKLWLIVTSILLYFSLRAQSKHNFGSLSLVSFCLAFSISIYFFLAGDFAGRSGRMAFWWMQNKPQVDLPDVHHGYISGLLVITSIFATYWLWEVWNRRFSRFNRSIKLIVVFVIVVISWAFILTMSRGMWAVLVVAIGIGVMRKIIVSTSIAGRIRKGIAFPVFILIFLGAIITLIYIGPARTVGDTPQSNYGTNTRAELQSRGTYFLADYPITGGGLNSFPGLYSQYMIMIPFFYFVNSYNLFLDIGIEQGIFGAVVFLFIYLGSVWLVSQIVVNSRSRQTRFLAWLCLLMLSVIIVHGVFYDYLYNGPFTMLMFVPVGVTMAVFNSKELEDESSQLTNMPFPLREFNSRKLMYGLIFVAIVMVALNIRKIRSIWYSNLGAVQMSQAELKDFPLNEWISPNMLPDLKTAEISLHKALQYDPANLTANYRLGLISMLRQDYETAIDYLEIANNGMPDHRGVIKSLGYSYVWIGDMEKAHTYLAQIPETEDELDVYVWWWEEQGRNDLSEKASLALEKLIFANP